MAKGSKVGSMYVQLTLDGKEYEAKLRRAKGESQRGGKQMEKSFDGVTRSIKAAGAALGVYFSGRAILSGIKSVTAAFMEQEKAVRNLNAALEITGRYTVAASRSFQQFAREMQRQTVYGDEAVLQVTALLAQLTKLDNEGLKAATRGAIGLASVFNMDLQSAAQTVAKALSGNIGALSRYVSISADAKTETEKIADVMSKLGVLFKRAEADTETLWGQTQQLKNMWGDFKEVIGGGIAVTLESAGAMDKLTAAIEHQLETIEKAKDVQFGNLIIRVQELDAEIKELERQPDKKTFLDNWTTRLATALSGQAINIETTATELLEGRKKERNRLLALIEKKQGRPLGEPFPKTPGQLAEPKEGPPKYKMEDFFPLHGMVQFGESLKQAGLQVSLFGTEAKSAAQKLSEENTPLTRELIAQRAKEPAKPPEEKTNQWGTVGKVMGGEFWKAFKKESKASTADKLSAVNDALEAGLNASQAVFSMFGKTGTRAQTVTDRAMGGAAAGMALGGPIGAGVGAVVGGFGGYKDSQRAARERRRAREEWAREYSQQFQEASGAGFIPMTGIDLSYGEIKARGKELEKYLKRLDEISGRLKATFQTALNDALKSSTAAEASERFGDAMAAGFASGLVAKSAETMETLMMKIMAPVYQVFDDIIHGLETQIGKITYELRKQLSEAYKGLGKQIDQIFQNIAKTVGDPIAAAILTALYLAMPRLVARVSELVAVMGRITTKMIEPSLQRTFEMVQRLERFFGIEPEWIKEMEKAGLMLSQDMGKNIVEGMKDAWSSLKDTIRGALEAGFNSYTVSSGWRNFQMAMKEGIYKFVVDGLITALIGGGLFLGALAPVLKDFVVLFKKSVKDGFDVDMFSKLITDVLGNVNKGLAEIAPLFAAIFPEVERLRQGLVGSGATHTPITAEQAGTVPQAPEQQTPLLRLLWEAFQQAGQNAVLQIQAFVDAFKEWLGDRPLINLSLAFFEWLGEMPKWHDIISEAWQEWLGEMPKWRDMFTGAIADWLLARPPWGSLFTGAWLEWLGRRPLFSAIFSGAWVEWLAKRPPWGSLFTGAWVEWLGEKPKWSDLFDNVWARWLAVRPKFGDLFTGEWWRWLGARPRWGDLFAETWLKFLRGGAATGLPEDPRITGYATGTPYVPYDMVAKVHKGEAIIPAADNRRGKAGAVINNTFNISGGDPRAIARAIGFELETQLRGAY